MVQGYAVGVLNLSMTNETDRFGVDLDTALTIARDAAVAVHRVRLFEESCRDPLRAYFRVRWLRRYSSARSRGREGRQCIVCGGM